MNSKKGRKYKETNKYQSDDNYNFFFLHNGSDDKDDDNNAGYKINSNTKSIIMMMMTISFCRIIQKDSARAQALQELVLYLRS